jgi:hypothetical protein
MRRRRRSSAGAVTHEATKPEAPDPKPPSDGERKKLVLSLRMRDVTHPQSGKCSRSSGRRRRGGNYR